MRTQAQLTDAISQITSSLTMTASEYPSSKTRNASVPYKTKTSSAGLLLVLAAAVSLSFACGYFHHVIQQTILSDRFLLASPLLSLNQERVARKANDSNYNNKNNSDEPTRAPMWSTTPSHVRRVNSEYDYYYESLIHPTMLTHDNPQRVAILCGVGTSATTQGASAIVRQVLKHNTVEQVVVLSMDISHTVHFDDVLRTQYRDDTRVKIVDEAALKWFTESYRDDEDKDSFFDVIIVDTA
jgi:mannitol-specific phosphotransferase system IIBC component